MKKVCPRHRREECRCSFSTIDTADLCLDFPGHSGCDLASQPLKSSMAIKFQCDSLADQIQMGHSETETTSSPKPKPLSSFKNTVHFTKVEIRTYPIVLSDNPSTSTGPPIGIDWRHDPNNILISDIDSYESQRDEPGVRRTKNELPIPPKVREKALIKAGYSPQEIGSAVKKVKKDKQRRDASFRKQKFEPILIKVEVAKSGFKRIISTRKEDHHQQHPLFHGHRDSLAR